MSQLFVVESKQKRKKDKPEWVPLPDAHTSALSALRAMQEIGTERCRVVVYRRAGIVNALRCEECELMVVGDDLPEGWSQFGKSRFLDAPTGLASHCPEHSSPKTRGVTER